ncbi:MAG: hypothetical protein KAI47_05680 [Deltaproteobacteria bacterium]|nr:hypothetical protein [Deltaproteobacteria bacterium]
MDVQELLKELEDLSNALGVTVSYERFSGDGVRSGGLCKVKGSWKAIIERRSATTEKLSVLARCLGRFDIEGQTVSPELRLILDRHHPRDEGVEAPPS